MWIIPTCGALLWHHGQLIAFLHDICQNFCGTFYRTLLLRQGGTRCFVAPKPPRYFSSYKIPHISVVFCIQIPSESSSRKIFWGISNLFLSIPDITTACKKNFARFPENRSSRPDHRALPDKRLRSSASWYTDRISMGVRHVSGGRLKTGRRPRNNSIGTSGWQDPYSKSLQYSVSSVTRSYSGCPMTKIWRPSNVIQRKTPASSDSARTMSLSRL